MSNTDNKLNIADAWKEIDNIQINISNVWKDIDTGYINVGDSWEEFWSGYTAGDRGVFFSRLAVANMEYLTISTLGNTSDFGDLITQHNNLTTAGTSNGTNGRGIIPNGTDQSGYTNNIEYITISTLDSATDFGDMYASDRGWSGTSNRTNERGVFTGRDWTTQITYITINSPGNSLDFGDQTVRTDWPGFISNHTNERGVYFGGYRDDGGAETNVMEYITINSTGNALDFGNLIRDLWKIIGTSNGTNERGVMGGGGMNGSTTNRPELSYITINSKGNATSFGNLIEGGMNGGAVDNATNERAVFHCGQYNPTGSQWVNVDWTEYITINSTGNATEFGDFTVAAGDAGACSDA